MAAEREQTAGDVLRWSAGLLTSAAAAIHFAVIRDHLDEYWVFGLFFAVAAWLQMLWSLAIVTRAPKKFVLAGIVGNAAIAVVWAISRTTGLPFGPNAGSPEPVAFIDVAATVAEVLATFALAWLLRESFMHRTIRQRAAVAAILVVAALVVPATTAAIAFGTDHLTNTHERERMSHENKGP